MQEVLLRRIATDPNLEGVSLPAREGGGEMETLAKQVRERAYADDTKVWLRDMKQVGRLREIVREFESVSGQRLNISESVGVRF